MLDARTVTEDPQMLRAAVLNLVTMATLPPVFVQSFIVSAIIRRHFIFKMWLWLLFYFAVQAEVYL